MIGIITFHAAYNFGSVLQAFALQEVIKEICVTNSDLVDCRIINYRSNLQKAMYDVFQKNSNIKNILKNILKLPYARDFKEKNIKFEGFIKNKLNLTEEINSEESFAELAKQFDCIISGSDQIWNVRATDFSYIYLLDGYHGKKISYAASLGPLKIDWSQYNRERFCSLINEYQRISVREKGSIDNLNGIVKSNPLIHLDPTLLLCKQQWESISSGVNYNDGNYILLYCLEPTMAHLKIAKDISKKLNLPIVVLRYNNKYDYINCFVKKYNSGPADFISYISHAKLVLTTSFHGTAFSINLHKPFFVIDGMKDNRIKNLLELVALSERSIEQLDYNDKIMNAFDIDYKKVTFFLESEVAKSKQYLINEVLYG